MNKAFWYLDVKSFDDSERTFEGIASTPAVDRMGDILEPKGAKFTLPLPMLWQHGRADIDHPVGWITAAKVKADGIFVKGKFANLDGPPTLKEALDKAWALVKSGLVRGLSVGFNPIEFEPIKNSYGSRFTEWEWLELSPVAIAANAPSMITAFKSMGDFDVALAKSKDLTSVKSLDIESLAALGQKRNGVIRLDKTHPPGVSGNPKTNAMNIAEQITQWDAKLASAVEQRNQIMEKALAESRVLEEEEQKKYDELFTEKEKISKHIDLLKDHEKSLVTKATPIDREKVIDAKTGSEAREGRVISVKANQEKGIGVARMAIAMVRARGNPYQAMELAKQHWGDQSPEVVAHIKSVVEAGDTTTSGWASQLVPSAQQMDGEFLDMLRDLVIMGRIQGFKRVPFNISVPLQSGGGTYGYVGEGAPKPVTKPTYGSATLRFEKAAGIIVITEELARFSRPDAEMLVRDELLAGLTNFFDTVFVSATAAVSNVSPAGILNGISGTAATGTTANHFRHDMNVIIQNMITNKQDPASLTILMSSGISMSLSSMQNSLSQPEFSTINANGGNYLGIPIVTSQALGTNIILLKPGDILLAEDPAMSIDVSREASVEMDTAPAGGESSPVSTISTLKSFWQNNLVGLRVEQYRTWKVARTSAVEFISGAGYTPPTS